MKKIDLTKIIDIKDLQQQYNISDSKLINSCIGYDNNIYLLFYKKIEKNSSSTHYCAIKIIMDWEKYHIINTLFYDFGFKTLYCPFIRPLGDYFLLLDARCWYHSKDNIERNALIVDEHGTNVNQLCFGDGIEHCITTADMKIITSYFDEGIFGNLGWDDPIGSCGLIMWDCNGNIVWQNTKYSIDDCYALNMDNKGNLWFYYYDEFNLVCTDFNDDNDKIMAVDIKGFDTFAISETQKNIIFSGGYKNDFFYISDLDITNRKISKNEKIDFYCSGKLINKEYGHFYGSKFLGITPTNELFAHNFI